MTEVEAPAYFAPRQAQQGAQEDRVLPQVAAVQVWGSKASTPRTFRGTPAFQSRRRESEAQRRPRANHDLLPMYFSCMPAFRFIPVSLPGFGK